jgi:hypothetical protein
MMIAFAILSVVLPAYGARSPQPTSVAAPPDAFSAAASVPGARFVHTATAANITENYTYIDHPLTNNNPNAIVLVTQNYNPGGGSGTYNVQPIGVWYSSSAQKWAIFNQDNSTSMPVGADFNVLIPATGPDAFVHTATIANSGGASTYIDHPLTNGNPSAIVLVTHNYNPGGVGGTYNDHPVGVRYDGTMDKWAIFNQDYSGMVDGTDFNVLIPPTGRDVFVHTATVANTFFNYTLIDHPITNNNPNAILLVTHNLNPGGASSTHNAHSIGVWYSSSAKKWAVFNQDNSSSMPVDAAFNVLIPTTDWAVFVHTATAANIAGHYTYIDHPLTNDNPNAIVFVTQNYNPGGGASGIRNDHATGVWYSSGAKKWAIFNQDYASMPVGVAFNVLIPAVDTSVFVHIARAGNITNNWTTIDHPLTNNNPDAIVLVTQNWNPSGVGNTYNGHPIGVWYDGVENKWAVFNQDMASMPVDAAFNVLATSADTAVFVHTATAANIYFNYTLIDHTLTNENPNALIFATQNYNPGGGASQYNNQPIGVWYSNGAQKWSVFNQDTASSMPVGADFNVIVIFPKVYLPLVLRGT